MGNSWVDYANLGMNAANAAMNAEQLRSLSEANSQLAQLSQIEADRERRRQIENKLRQFVFDQEIKLKDLVETSGATSAAKWFGATLIKQELDSVPVSASSFQEFVDKDRVAAFQRQIIQTIQDNQRQLTANQLSELQWAIRILNERQALSEYIAAVQAQEYLDQTKTKWEEMEKIADRPAGCLWLVILAFVGLSVFVLIVPKVISYDDMGFLYGLSLYGRSLYEMGFLIWVAMLPVTLVFYAIYRSVTAPKVKGLVELRMQRDAATNKVPRKQRLQELRQLFGANVTSAGPLLQEQQRREQSLTAIVSRI
ncbi:MAG TPA: hypothetical protein PLI34_17425 [Saprospiraceae bacterium]|nr:hypothetical protein [Saprospiraceae bacterium]